MIIGRISLLFLIYSFLVFLGTPNVLLALQSIALAGACGTVLVCAVRQRSLIFPPLFLAFFFLFLTYLCFNLILGLENGQTPPAVMIRFLQNFLLTLSMPLLGYSFSRLGIMSNEKILNHVLRAMIIYAGLKISIVAVAVVFNISTILLSVFFLYWFNAAPAFGSVVFGIPRFLAPTDFLLPFLLYYSLSYMKGWPRFFVAVLAGACIFISYSRFIWLEAVFFVLVYLLTLSRGKIVAVLASLMIVVPIVASSVHDVPVIEERFFSNNASVGDDIRLRQYDALTGDMDQHFLFGHGFASFALNMVRDPVLPYSYELQWVAFAYQMGFVGIIFLLGLVFSNSAPLLASRSITAVPVLLIYVFSLLSGLANPSLVGRTSGIGFLFILCLGTLVRDRVGLRRESIALHGPGSLALS